MDQPRSVIRSPLPHRAGDTAATPVEPDFSIIVPLARDHGHGMACLESLVQKQTYDRRKYEVIALANGSLPDLERRAKELLGPNDSLIYHPSQNEFELYHVGALAARGRVLFFLESHSVAAPDCLAEMREFLEAHNLDGARCRDAAIGVDKDFLKALELRTFEEDSIPHLEDDHWRKVSIHGFAIARDVYFAESGFEYEYGQFCVLAFAARLHSSGRKLRYSPKSIVHHYYAGSLAEAAQLSADNNLGEVLYRSRHPADYCERYFGHMLEWSFRGNYRADLARALSRAILSDAIRRLLTARLPSFYEHVRELVDVAPTAAVGPRWSLLKTRAMRWLALARIWTLRGDADRSYRAYRDYLRSLFLHDRVRGVAGHLSAWAPAPMPSDRMDLVRIDEERLFGFFGPEDRDGRAHRWSGAAALIEVSPSRAAYVLELDVVPLRPNTSPPGLTAFFDGHRLRRLPADADADSISFRLEASMFRNDTTLHTLALISRAYQPSKGGSLDRRKLGVAIRTIRFRPADVQRT